MIERQAALALAMGCERIVCLAEGLPPELIQLQHQVERSGARFQAIRGREALHALVSASDEVLVIGDGALPDLSVLQSLLGTRKGVLVMPADQGLPAGYERIDRDWCWAGAVRCSGAEVERLVDLPPDVDPLGALMRSALQAGRPIIPLPEEVMPAGQWRLILNATTALVAGQHLLSQGYRPAHWSAPGNALIDRISLRHADELLRRIGLRLGLWAAMVIGGGAAAFSAYFDELTWALFSLAISSMTLRVLVVVQRIENEAVTQASQIEQAIPDLALLILLLVAGSAGRGEATIYPLLVLLVGLHICCRLKPEPVRDFGAERPGLLVVLMLASSIGETSFVLQLLSLTVLGLVFVVLGKDRLTGA